MIQNFVHAEKDDVSVPLHYNSIKLGQHTALAALAGERKYRGRVWEYMS